MNMKVFPTAPLWMETYNDAMMWMHSASLLRPGTLQVVRMEDDRSLRRVWYSQVITSCELFLKSMHAFTTSDKASNTHMLTELYDGLGCRTRSAIDAQFMHDFHSKRINDIRLGARQIGEEPPPNNARKTGWWLFAF